MPLVLKSPDGDIPLTVKVACVDAETYYDDEYSVSSMSYHGYTRDPRFDCYRFSIACDDFEWVGHPKDAPWDRIKDHVWVSHNRAFDQTVYEALQEKGIVPAWLPRFWGDSMNLCAYIRAPRALAKAVFALYGEKISKEVRDKDIKGKHWHEMDAELQAKLDVYALGDARWSRRIWVDHIHLWPTTELRIADQIVNRGLRGVAIDREGCEEDMKVLQRVLFEAEQKIPWRDSGTMLSKELLAAECRKVGIEPPASLSMKDEDTVAWEEEYGEKYVWVAAMRDWRRMNALLMKYQTIVDRIKPNGRAEFSIRYLGTHTGRTAAGETGYDKDRKTFNMLNLPREPFYIRADYTVAHKKKELRSIGDFVKKNGGKLPEGIIYGVDLRRKIIPGPGMKFVICDMSQIEARITNWLARDKKTLDLVRSGLSVYDVHAITLMGWVPKIGADGKPISLKKESPQMYALAKARELALGFQAGHVKFIEMAPTYISDEDCEAIFGAPVTPQEEQDYLDGLTATKQKHYVEEYPTLTRAKQIARVNSQKQVQSFRKAKKILVDLWYRMQNELKRSVGGTHEIGLPSGRVLKYFDVVADARGKEIKARVELGGAFLYFYGGKLLENTVQATARDVFVEGQLKLADAGIDVILDVYDENVTEVPLDFPKNRVAEIMTQNPEWAKTLPLGAEVEESQWYKK